MTREDLGRLVRETWVAWAREQPDPKPSWLAPWEDLDAGQREVDMRIGEAVAFLNSSKSAADLNREDCPDRETCARMGGICQCAEGETEKQRNNET